MKPLSPKAQVIYDAIGDEWVDPLDLEISSGLTYMDRCTYCASLTRRGLVERDTRGWYRRVRT